ncbi:unnamed protein product [Calypogeia fissa]
MATKELSRWQILHGVYAIAVGMFSQKIQCRHLPKRLPLRLSPDFTAIVTGSTSGIGLQIAGELAKAGAHVVLAVRNTTAGEQFVQEWIRDQQTKGGPSINAEVMELNLLSLESVRAFANYWSDRQLPLNVLVNNAGIFAMGVEQKFTEDRYEQHMQVNHLGHALLSMLLLPSLVRGAPARIINVASIIHHLGFLDPEDMNLTKGNFSPLAGYAGSKMAQIWFNWVLQMRIPKEAGVDVFLAYPGETMTKITRDASAFTRKTEPITKILRFSSLTGARSVLFCATDQQVLEYARAQRETGFPVPPYFLPTCKPGEVASHAQDLASAEKVFSKTLELVGLPEDYIDTALTNESVSSRVDDAKPN